MEIKRVFIPLSKEPFEWFKSGIKTWELRRYGRQYTERNIKEGQIVELRCGYGNPANALWGIIKEVIICNCIEQVFEQVGYSSIIPFVYDKNEAIEKSKRILNLSRYEGCKFIVFKIEILDNPEFISLSDEYFEDVRKDIKKSTIRYGKRFYKKGACILYSESQSELVYITKVEYKLLNNLANENIIVDGFRSFNELTKALSRFYSELKEDDEMTIIHFEYLGGKR